VTKKIWVETYQLKRTLDSPQAPVRAVTKFIARGVAVLMPFEVGSDVIKQIIWDVEMAPASRKADRLKIP
jgi:hypothetical protein